MVTITMKFTRESLSTVQTYVAGVRTTVPFVDIADASLSETALAALLRGLANETSPPERVFGKMTPALHSGGLISGD